MKNNFLLSLIILTLIKFSLNNDEEFEYDPKLEIKINSNPSKELIDTANTWNSFLCFILLIYNLNLIKIFIY